MEHWMKNPYLKKSLLDAGDEEGRLGLRAGYSF